MVLELQLITIKIPGVSQQCQSVTVTVAGPDGCDSPGPGSATVVTARALGVRPT